MLTDLSSVATFLTYCEDDRGWSANTTARYKAVLATLMPFGDPLTIDPDGIQQWWDSRIWRVENGKPIKRANSSRANELASLRTYYKWATKFSHRPDDPTRVQDFPLVDNHVPRPIGESDLTRLLGPLTEDAPDLRRAVALGAYSGLRVSEAAGLSWSDIDHDSRRIYLRGKARKERVFGLTPILLDKLLPDTGGNVVTAGGKPYTGPVLQRKVNRLMERNGIGHTFHDLRKRGATMVLAKGISPFAVAQAFGWSSIQTAQSYAVVGDETLDQIAAAMI